MELLYLVIGMFVGYMLVYMLAPCPKIVVKHPTLKNIGKTTYIDNNNVHYRYKKINLK